MAKVILGAFVAPGFNRRCDVQVAFCQVFTGRAVLEVISGERGGYWEGSWGELQNVSRDIWMHNLRRERQEFRSR